ncbi:hypothetical protein [Thermoplasma volcanium GSS1]|uniref:Diphthamide synthase domain-containing protein n=2 Tax=Thermoplasma volcanium TaxID=50339 RepID=Q979Y0_THEVO|nr:hypothetical protein [Thermoplasma volcanium GSS1]
MSGGKDSFLSAVIAIEQGLELEKALIVKPSEYSYMFHFPNVLYATETASLLDLEYEFVDEAHFERKISELAGEGLNAIVSGAIASEYQKTRIERLCTANKIVSFTPLWKIDQERIIREIINAGIRAMIVSVSAEGLGEQDLGKEINLPYLDHLKSLEKRYGINISGEGGEYESFVFGYGSKVKRVQGHRVWSGSGGYFIIDRIES